MKLLYAKLANNLMTSHHKQILHNYEMKYCFDSGTTLFRHAIC